MKRLTTLRRRLFAPLVYLAAIVLLIEEWLWDLGATLMAFIATWPPIHALERRIKALPPYAALAAFAAPAILLLPVKILALFAIARGHAVWGMAVILAAKIGGAAAVARLYALTRPSLLSLAWFARWHNAFIAIKDRWIARLRASHIYRRVHGLRTAMAAALRSAWFSLFPRRPAGQRSRLPRVLRRFAALWRARRPRARAGNGRDGQP
ncbi:MAG: hypothetical protein V4582_07130 [Pseudomonadota bacterium]